MARAAVGDHGRPSVGPSRMQSQRSDAHPDSKLEPSVEVLPSPVVHADLASFPALTAAHENAAARGVEIAFRETERLAPCCAEGNRDESRAWSPANAGDQQHREQRR